MTDELSFEIRPSTVQGVGVFARVSIIAGEELDLWGDEPPAIQTTSNDELIVRHGVRCGGVLWRPPFMNRMAIGWYLNHSDTANVSIGADDVARATKPILVGEELFINYAELEAQAEATEKAAKLLEGKG